jgi:outer membrane receptor protein involved in Fe transport
MNHITLKKAALVTACSLATCMPSFSYAQGTTLETMIVTATKREATLQEIPVAVTVTTAETIERAAINDLKDMQSVVPSLKINTLQGSSETNFFIRGFGNGANNPGIEPSVGLFIDGVYRSRSASAITDLPNVERVEVLRGPQSTLFGKNASAGVISVVSAAPDGEARKKVSATIGNYSQFDLKGYIADAISESTAFDLAASYRSRDGWADNLTTGSDLNDVDRVSLRGQIASDLDETTSLRVIADYSKIEETCCMVTNSFTDPSVGFAFSLVGGNLISNDRLSTDVRMDVDPVNDVENKGISLHFDKALDGMDFTSITAYRTTDNSRMIDLDFTDVSVFTNSIDSSYDTFTQEFRLASNNDSNLQWLAGMFYFDESVDHRDSISYGSTFRPLLNVLSQGAFTNAEAAFGLPAGLFFTPGASSTEDGTLENQSISLFTQLDWEINERTTATLGLNYTKDKKEATLSQSDTDIFSSIDPAGLVSLATGLPYPLALAGIESGAIPNPLGAAQAFQFLPPVQPIPNGIEDGKTDDDDLTYTLRLAYDLTDNTNIYAGVSTGFKATSWNLSRDSRPTPETRAQLIATGQAVPNLKTGTRFASPEESTVYELGLKSSFDQGSVYVTLFSQEIKGFQSNTFTGAGFNLTNAGKQTTDGIEIELTYFPTEDLKLGFAGTFLDPVYDSFVSAAGVVPGTIQDLSGQKVRGVHETSITVTAEYSFAAFNNWDGFARASYQYEDDIQTNENVPAAFSSEEYKLLNASIGATSPNGLGIMLWGRNLTDHETETTGFPLPGVPGLFNTYRNQPRTFGVTVSKEF